MAPRSAPGAARSDPRGAKTAPGAAKRDPGAPQEPPKRRTKGAKKDPVIDSALGGGPGGLREPFRSDLGAILEPPGWHFGAIFKTFFFVSSDPLSPPAREAFQATPQLKTLSGGAERAREA